MCFKVGKRYQNGNNGGSVLCRCNFIMLVVCCVLVGVIS